MLTEGLLRYQRKHGGLTAAVAAFAILATFNASRAAFWSLRAWCSRRIEVSQRRNHFLGVVAGFRSVWPRRKEETA